MAASTLEQPQDCSIAASLDFVGDRWSLLILRDIFRGVRRFGDVCEDLGIARNILTDRLDKLVERDILRKVQYSDRPARFEYHLTDKGRDLSPALIALMRWGDRWAFDGEPPTRLVHDACGTELELTLRCPHCATAVTPTHVRSRHDD
ncbi:MAG TPA: helix-turn-helix domain-containing protein [Ilumatobacteraceae bacterium]|nr:helix-turn-helix domain-containing protein [Ilumatobacteraceae bacterium]